MGKKSRQLYSNINPLENINNNNIEKNIKIVAILLFIIYN